MNCASALCMCMPLKELNDVALFAFTYSLHNCNALKLSIGYCRCFCGITDSLSALSNPGYLGVLSFVCFICGVV